jgi:hypothetical protein
LTRNGEPPYVGVFSTFILWIAKNHAPVKQMKNAALNALDRLLIPTYKNL